MSEVIAETQTGKVCGKKDIGFNGIEFCSFKGIPYAKPPVGELRFKDPEPAASWTNVRVATNFGPNCAQRDFFTKQIVGSDDCLYLNVYVRCITSKQRWPVMVWIHGGGFVCGSGDESFFGPDYFMSKDVVLVTINYRVGVLGFLNLDDEVAPGNQGLKDQVMALTWVRNNIENFGGDPYNVTIFGESAGGASVHYLTISSLAKGLFHKAISQSGVALNPWAYHSNVELKEKAHRICQELGHTGKDAKSIVEFLRMTDIKTLIEAQEKIVSKEEKIQFIFSFGPTTDSKSKNPFMPIHPEEATSKGTKVPMIIGYNSREGMIFLSDLLLEKNNLAEYINDSGKALHSNTKDTMKKLYNLTVENLMHIYFRDETITNKNRDKLADFMGDVQFVEGIQRVIKTQIENSDSLTYFYQFTYDKEISVFKLISNINLTGASHGDDIEYLFKTHFFKDKIESPKKSSVKHRISEQMIELWVNFATTGIPTPKLSRILPFTWEPVNKEIGLRYLNICDNVRMEVAIDIGQHYAARKYPKKRDIIEVESLRVHTSIMDELVVETRAGKVQGAKQISSRGNEFYSFKGIPYAKPPTGKLRFQDPKPMEPWTGVRETTSHGQNCAQLDFLTNEIIGGDDCLYLNVYAKSIDANAKWPVMVWIHGAAFVAGSGDDSYYGPDYFMCKDVVLVTINYRFGILGFLNLQDEVATGNQGLKDQVMALRWVRDNISNFGGNLENVTIFGSSVGAASVHFLALSPMAKGLFHKVISQSGSALNPWVFLSDPKEKVYQLCEHLGFTDKQPKSIVQFLRSIDTNELIEAQENLSLKKEGIWLSFPFGPSLDSHSDEPFMPVHPEIAADEGIQVPLIIGHNSREGIIHLKDIAKLLDKFNNETDKVLHPNAVEVIKKLNNLTPENLKRIYFNDEKITAENLEKMVDLIGDLYFVEGIHRILKKQVESSCAPTYFYQLTYDRGPSIMKRLLNTTMSGVCHTEELKYLFRAHFLDDKITFPGIGTDEYRITEQLIEMWVTFATVGKPTADVSALTPCHWLPVNDKTVLRFLNIGQNLRMEVVFSLEKLYAARKHPKSK
ncbi:neuroligin-1-like [Phymastichus coffea]|uniref:neuroligin-1-like n=1 Tax=Phymastichus coffea TaxID=108790 RepID=UPI00273C9732|nr:neuroligin-1-like [Phymastichus coffea]